MAWEKSALNGDGLHRLQDSTSLEDLTGLTALHASTAAFCDDLDLSDDGSVAELGDQEDEWTAL